MLLDGSIARLRPVRPADAGGLKDLFGRVTPRSRYLRFHHYSPGLTDDQAERYSADNDPDFFGVVVSQGDGDAECIIGVGHYFRLDGSRAEVAFLVDDPFQGHGVATLILEELANFARSRGFDTFEAEVLGENRKMMDVFQGAGFPLTTSLRYGEMHVTFPITELHPAGAAAV